LRRGKDGRTRPKRSRVLGQGVRGRQSQRSEIRKIIRENPSRDFHLPCTGDACAENFALDCARKLNAL